MFGVVLFLLLVLKPAQGDLVADGLIASWVFDPVHVIGQSVTAAFGSDDATIVGPVNLTTNPAALTLNGSTNHVVISDDISMGGVTLPAMAFTAEAWVAVNLPLDWGGIYGTVEDTGSHEKGWILGYNGQYFSLGLATVGADDGDGLMTYLHADTPFELGAWYHVVGTYDGATMCIYVNGQLRGSSTVQSGAIDNPEASVHAPYEIGVYHDSNELWLMNGRVLEVRLYDRALSQAEVAANCNERSWLFPLPPAQTLPPAVGPVVKFTGKDTALVRWWTDEAKPSIVEYGKAKPNPDVAHYGLAELPARCVEDLTAQTVHALEIPGLELNTPYLYRVVFDTGSDPSASRWYELDTTFNYSVPAVPAGPPPYPANALTALYSAAADRILAQTATTTGYCFVVGCGAGQLAYELAKRSDLRIIGVDADAQAIVEARACLSAAGVYGSRVTVQQSADLSHLPFTKCSVSLIVSDRMISEGVCVSSASELYRLLEPIHGVAYLGQPRGAAHVLDPAALSAWLAAGSLPDTVVNDSNGIWANIHKPSLPGAGEWTHQYGHPDNAANSWDTLGGATGTGDMQVQWIGRPGPQAMTDRNPRQPAPLYTNGRLFTQGERRIIAQDAYNGVILWSLEIPDLLRYNMPKDCSNWCADEDSLYAAIRDKCWRINGATGALERTYDGYLPAGLSWTFDWGYVAQVGAALFGSSVKEGSVFTDLWGGAGWAEDYSGPVTNKACSDALFAVNKDSGTAAGRQEAASETTLWTYDRSDRVIINGTITIGGNRVYFVECRNATVKASASRRVGLTELWSSQYLVALDPGTGSTLWEQPIDTADGVAAFYLLYSGEKLILVASDTQFHVYAFDATNGNSMWYRTHGWPPNGHSEHMHHPVVVGANAVFQEPRLYDLNTGAVLQDNMAIHTKCSTYSASQNVLLFRGGNYALTMCDVNTRAETGWERLRPSCWLSTITGGGMVLSPEGGGGCSCGGWLETSLGFIPKD